MYEYSNLFLGVGIAVSLFLFVQHLGYALIRYFTRYYGIYQQEEATKEGTASRTI